MPHDLREWHDDGHAFVLKLDRVYGLHLEVKCPHDDDAEGVVPRDAVCAFYLVGRDYHCGVRAEVSETGAWEVLQDHLDATGLPEDWRQVIERPVLFEWRLLGDSEEPEFWWRPVPASASVRAEEAVFDLHRARDSALAASVAWGQRQASGMWRALGEDVQNLIDGARRAGLIPVKPDERDDDPERQ